MAFFSQTSFAVADGLFPICGVFFTADYICEEKARIQSEHDRTTGYEYGWYELEILAHYKRIQSARDSARIKALKQARDGATLLAQTVSLAPYRVGSSFYTATAIVDLHKRIQSAHSKDHALVYSGDELQIEHHYREIQSLRDSARIKRAKQEASTQQVVTDEEIPVTDEEIPVSVDDEIPVSTRDVHVTASDFAHEVMRRLKLIESALQQVTVKDSAQVVTPSQAVTSSRVVFGKHYTDEMICAAKAEIQSRHDRDRSLEYTDFEREIIDHYKQIQSARDSVRIRAMRAARISSQPMSDVPTSDTTVRGDFHQLQASY